MVSHAHVRLSWVADGADRGVYVAAVSDSGRGAGNARLTATGLDFCDCHVSERRGAHAVLDSGTHRVSRDLSAPGAGILFFSVIIRGFPVADDKTAAHRACGFSIANRLLAPPDTGDAMLGGLLSSFA